MKIWRFSLSVDVLGSVNWPWVADFGGFLFLENFCFWEKLSLYEAFLVIFGAF